LLALNRRTGRTDGNKSVKQVEPRLTVKNMAIEQVKQEILPLVDKGTNYRDITKKEWLIKQVVS